jgi:predicted extracellular nuclease
VSHSPRRLIAALAAAALTTTGVVAFAAPAAAASGDLLISEYVEGSSNNKAIEIYNADGEAGNLGNCVLNIYFAPNSTVGNAVDLSGTLGPGERYVVCDDDFAQPDLCDLLAPGNFWNGDDSVELRCGTTTLDVFGQIGADPGDEWLAGGVGTQNETLRRDCLVTTGDNDGSDAFDPSAQWDTFAQDTFADLGFYDCG